MATYEAPVCSSCGIHSKRLRKRSFLVPGQLVIIGPGAATYKSEIKGELKKKSCGDRSGHTSLLLKTWRGLSLFLSLTSASLRGSRGPATLSLAGPLLFPSALWVSALPHILGEASPDSGPGQVPTLPLVLGSAALSCSRHTRTVPPCVNQCGHRCGTSSWPSAWPTGTASSVVRE